ncbi:uncharacterized protein [Excalfactoria chinensis]|uniref:uncharacterized protein n=1 Tax=Excalfactoria chinensis TaxID=46218 RepID=UPI003B3B094B
MWGSRRGVLGANSGCWNTPPCAPVPSQPTNPVIKPPNAASHRADTNLAAAPTRGAAVPGPTPRGRTEAAGTRLAPSRGPRSSPRPGAEQLGAASGTPPSVPPHPGGPRKAAAAPPPPCAGAVMALPPALRLCAALLVVLLLPAAAAQQQEAVGECQQYTNRSCEECLKNVTCLWCASSRRCVPYPVRRILPPADLCELRSARWGVCWVNFEALIIAMSVVGGMILIMLLVCCCCCCKKKSKKPDKEDERAARERERRRVRQEERRAEMKSRHDEIRRKYGLFKEENPYAKFEN